MESTEMYQEVRQRNGRVIWQNLTSRTALAWYRWTTARILLLVGLITSNRAPFYMGGAIVSWWVLFIVGVLLHGVLTTTKEEREQRGKERRYSHDDEINLMTSRSDYWTLARGPLLALLFSSLVYFPFDATGNRGAVVAILQNRITGYTQFIGEEQSRNSAFFIPGVVRVTQFPVKQDATTTCQAPLADDAVIQAAVKAELTLLTATGNVAATYEFYQSRQRLRQRIEAKLCRRLGAAVANYHVGNMPSNLVLEHHAGAEQRDMEDVGVRYSGVVAISNVHAYVRK
ncbi:MAG: hypothetical protein HY006_02665 [Candidatus Sungbacteria bacterium]|nr:hypothetical protein [Candidatus Sungbacteria bacterium]